MEDRQQRLNLGSLGRVPRAQVHCRVGIGRYEDMAWEHLVTRLIQGTEKTHRVAIKLQQKAFWVVVMQQRRAGKSTAPQPLMASSTRLFVSRKEKRQRRRIQKQFLVEGEGVERSFLLKTQAVDFYELHSRSIEYSEWIGRKFITLTMVTQGKALFLGYRELLGRQQLMQDCGLGEAGLPEQAQREVTTIHFDQRISSGGVRRQMINFAYSRGLGPVLETSK